MDRQPGAALETSFANGGQISASYAEPWANPGAPLKILRWLARDDAPLLFRPRLDWRQWRWGVQFLIECLPSRTRRNTIACLNLALYSRDCLKALRNETGIQYDQLERGILQFYTEPDEFERGVEAAGLMREYGCDRDVKTPDECVAIEPALAQCRDSPCRRHLHGHRRIGRCPALHGGAGAHVRRARRDVRAGTPKSRRWCQAETPSEAFASCATGVSNRSQPMPT